MNTLSENPIKLNPALRLLRQCAFPHKLGVMDRMFARQLSRQEIAWVETACGVVWKLDLRNSTHRWMVYGDYEGAGGFFNWLRKNVPPDGIVVDSGANIGQMSVRFAGVVKSGKVFAFEPGTAPAAWLAECIAANPQLPVEIVRLGLSDHQRDAYLVNDGAAHTHGSWCKVSDAGGEPIQLTTLDEFIARKAIRRVHLWKMDMEGHEATALRGAVGALQAGAIGALYVELSQDSGKVIAEFLAQFGYQPFSLCAKGTIYPALRWDDYDNVLFVRTA